MKTKLLQLSLILIVVFNTTFALSDQKQILEALYNSLDGENWDRSTNWMTNEPIENWYGVKVRDKVVVEINLAQNRLSGHIPKVIWDMQHLESLDLRWNSIGGSIPQNMSNMKKLNALLLSGNNLEGEIPYQIGELSSLGRLDLSYNLLSQEIPRELANANALQSIALQNNQLSGYIPVELADLKYLSKINLRNNNFSDLDSLNYSNSTNGQNHLYNNSNAFLNQPEKVFSKINERKPADFSALDLLDESSFIINNTNANQYIKETLKAIRVEDGFLAIDIRKV